MRHLLGAFPIIGICALATLDQTNAIRSPGWQAAFLAKAEPRAARPGKNPASDASRLTPACSVKSPRWTPLSHGAAPSGPLN
jgi:hypothetical protein